MHPSVIEAFDKELKVGNREFQTKRFRDEGELRSLEKEEGQTLNEI